jgi:phospholipid/cholesterol/gamma-HCH transport system substrate-binding protein
VVFGQMRFDRTNAYSAEFSNISGLRAGQFVRASGVEVGKVSSVHLIDGGTRARVDFNVDRSVPLYQSTTAQIRYLNLIGDRYLELKRGQGEGAEKILPPGGFIPLSRTSPALDLDALIGGFKPLFRALDPEKVNTIATALVTVFQGQGGTINDILDHTAQLTAQLGERDQAIGEVVKNLNVVLDTTVRHRKAFDDTVNNLEVLITGLKGHGDQLAGGTAHISNAAGTVADLLAEDRSLLHKTVNYLDAVQQPLIDQREELTDYLHKVPTALNMIGRTVGSYGDFVNFYACDISVKINGLQPGGPVRTVKLFQQPTGRCTPQ